jgi:hypothetical protein
VALLQEGEVRQPIDYREVVLSYTNPEQVARLLERPLRQVIARLQDSVVRTFKAPERFLEGLDLGDVAAENEIRGLRAYFVRTAQFGEARRGNARLVIGRKGSGKTAIFYAIRDSFANRRSHLVLDLKPEGHQFTRFREAVLSKLSPGLQEHTLTAFWNYILLIEIALKITDQEYSWAQRDPERRRRFETLRRLYGEQDIDETGDFSERLLHQVERLKERYSAGLREEEDRATASELTELLFHGDIRALDEAVASYLEEKDEVWLLIDNLDKGWPTRGSSSADILILRTLLEATRKLQRQLERRNVAFRCLVFLRNDIHEHLILETPDKGKDTAIILDWDDDEVFKEIVRRRIEAKMNLPGSFRDIWPTLFEGHVGAQDSFRYIIDRTLMRPRELLNFLHRCIEVSVNRGHERVLEEDITKAEEMYSEDILLATQFEVRDVYPEAGEPLYEFLGCRTELSREDVLERVKRDERVLDLLVWFGFLGVKEAWREEPEFSYQVRYNVAKLLAPVKQGRAVFVVHPAFRRALECQV